jgi:hypothetical protein
MNRFFTISTNAMPQKLKNDAGGRPSATSTDTDSSPSCAHIMPSFGIRTAAAAPGLLLHFDSILKVFQAVREGKGALP